MTGTRKAVCLAAFVATAATSLYTRAADPIVPDLPPQIPQNIRVIQLQEQAIIGGPFIIEFGPGPAQLPVEDMSDLNPIVGQGFASDRTVTGPITKLVAALHAESYAEREHASQDLMSLPPDRLQDVVAALAEETDPEAISRLKTVAGHLYLKPRTNVKGNSGFLGIGGAGPYVSMLGMKFEDPEKVRLPGTAEDSVVVRVSELQPGFPSAQELRAGDCIVAISGKGFPDEMVPVDLPVDMLPEEAFTINSLNRERKNSAKQMFQARIRALWPGSVVAFRILREGRVMDVSVQLAAMPGNARDSLSALVEIRNALMKTFVDSLKTGEQLQVNGRKELPEKLALGDYDWGTEAPRKAPLIKMGGSIMVLKNAGIKQQ